MTTVRDAIEEARLHLNGMRGDLYNVLDGSITDTDSTLTLSFATTGVDTGDFLGIESELLRVVDVDHDTSLVSVIRGVLGSTAAPHGNLTEVEVEPRFPDFAILSQMRREILSWPQSMFTTSTATIPARTQGLVSLGFDATFPLDAHAINTDGRAYRKRVQLVRGDPPQVQLTGGFRGAECFDEVEVTLAAPYDLSTFEDATDLEVDLGIHPEAHDIPAIGTAWRLVAPSEVDRTDTRQQGDPRIRQEVPPTHRLQTAAALKRMRDARLGEEAMRLRSRWPMLSGVSG